MLVLNIHAMENESNNKPHLFWDTSTSSQVWNCDGVVSEILIDHIFQWSQEDLNCEPLRCQAVA